MPGNPKGVPLTLHMIGNAHIDPVWLWRWPEGLEAARATFKSALDRIRETPGFIFTCSSAAIYQWVETTDPALFEQVRKAVSEGRWSVAGGWWIEPDCNMPCGEALVRQGLYGQRYFKEKFGVTARTGYNIDSFGHNAMLPQILTKSGMDSYVFMRPDKHEKELPPLFWWESDDGSRVLTYRIPISYTSEGGHLRERINRFMGEVRPLWPHMMVFYGVGNHGGGPTRNTIASILEIDKDPAMPRLEFSSPDRFFATIRTERLNLPVVHDELQHHASGCYSAISEIKRNNRKAENLLAAAEKFSVVAGQLVHREYPKTKLSLAWQDMLFNQFHDVMGGTSIPEAYRDARDMHGRCLQTGREELTFSTQAIAAHVDTSGAEPVLLVFNPHSWRVKLPVEFRPPLDGLVDTAGNPVLHQLTENPDVLAQRARSLAVVEVPPLGYRVFRSSKESLSESAVRARGMLEARGTVLENRWLRLEIDPDTGYVSELLDKQNNTAVFSGRGAIPIVIDDPSDTWSHGVLKFRDECGRFGDARVSLVENGPVRASLRVDSRYGNSTVTQYFSLYRELPYVQCRVIVEWHESYKMLKLAFPSKLEGPEATCEIPFGSLRRPVNGEEEPGLNWIDVTGRAVTLDGGVLEYGVSLVNDSKYSYDVKDAEIRLTVLRSPAYADLETNGAPPAKTYLSTDNSRQSFTYLILPHRGSWREAGTPRLGWELNQPPVTLVESNHGGHLPPAMSLIQIDARNVLLSALKIHEDSQDLVVRLYEAEGKDTVARIVFGDEALKAQVSRVSEMEVPWHNLVHRRWSARFAPSEVKTFRLPKDESSPVEEMNFLEMDVSEAEGWQDREPAAQASD